ncbi:hypothetical protein [Cellvibrio sp. QJXJ]|uniref:hypothetical protein n=1 Tax=Cellvibrio sp. QJXJ TaxID=2964606 RepID=UPI0021C3B449|nr:hypothetical protein [Cellvibrio sp. QJXJ]UUA71647.1 hypothetical protein NNX04_14635 [Cellvibrio sp. QJXJ]
MTRMDFVYSKSLPMLAMSLLLLINPEVSAEVNGTLQSHTAARVHTESCDSRDCEIPFSELRAQLKADYATNDNAHSFTANLELVQDFVFDETSARARELYWDWTKDAIQLRTGRQMITWGTGDMLFINDVFAKDWNAFFGGMPMDFLKRPTDAIKFDFYPGNTTIETVIARFDEDHLPEMRRFEMQFPSLAPPITSESNDDDLEYAGKLSRSFSGWDVSGYASKGYWRRASYQPAIAAPGTNVFYPRLNTYGASLTGQIKNGVLNLEAGYYDSRDDVSGSNPFIQNSQTRLLSGYNRQLWKDSTLGVQFYIEHMENYSEYRAAASSAMAVSSEWNRVATLRFTQFLMHQTLTVNVFSYWGLSESDRFLQSTLRYAFNDNLWGEIGTNIFSGNSQGMFGAFDRNDNLYLTLRLAY